MELIINTEEKTLVLKEGTKISNKMNLYSKSAFEILSNYWVKIGWDQKYLYTFSWLGRPIIQIPEDLIRVQEVIYDLKPDVVIETGIAHGGSLVFYASLCKLMGKGRVIGVDIEIRPHNRRAIESHELFPLITLIEGSSVDPVTISRVKNEIKSGEKVMVILDSCHDKDHVKKELILYSELVSLGSYIVVADGLLKDMYDVPRGQKVWKDDNPEAALMEFLNQNSKFIIEQPPWPFNESSLTENITHWPNGYLKRIS